MGIDLSEFYKSVEWDILGVPAARFFVGVDDDDDVIQDDEIGDDNDGGDDDDDDVIHDDEIGDENEDGDDDDGDSDFDLDAAYDDNDDAWNLINGRLIKGTRPYIGHL